VNEALASEGISKDKVFVYATTVKKIHEPGLLEAAGLLSVCLIFLDDDTINTQAVPSPSKAMRIGLLGVAEPCALAVAQGKELVMKKTVYGRVTVAIAR
jgi:cobalt-precorrin 5A hydrolase